jgi:hypothetical protein
MSKAEITAALRAVGFTGTALDAALLLRREQGQINAMLFGMLELHFDGSQMRLFRRDRMAAVQRRELAMEPKSE